MAEGDLYTIATYYALLLWFTTQTIQTIRDTQKNAESRPQKSTSKKKCIFYCLCDLYGRSDSYTAIGWMWKFFNSFLRKGKMGWVVSIMASSHSRFARVSASLYELLWRQYKVVSVRAASINWLRASLQYFGAREVRLTVFNAILIFRPVFKSFATVNSARKMPKALCSVSLWERKRKTK